MSCNTFSTFLQWREELLHSPLQVEGPKHKQIKYPFRVQRLRKYLLWHLRKQYLLPITLFGSEPHCKDFTFTHWQHSEANKHRATAHSAPELVSRGQPWWAPSQNSQHSEEPEEGPVWILSYILRNRGAGRSSKLPKSHFNPLPTQPYFWGYAAAPETEGCTTREVKWHGQLIKALRMQHFILHFSTDFKHPPHGNLWFLTLLLDNDWKLSAHMWQQSWPESEESFKLVPETHPSFATRIRTEALQPFPQLCNSTDPFGKAGFLTHPNSQLHSLKYQHSSLLVQQSKTWGHQSAPVNQAGCV